LRFGGGNGGASPGPVVRAFLGSRAGLGVSDQRRGAARELRGADGSAAVRDVERPRPPLAADSRRPWDGAALWRGGQAAVSLDRAPELRSIDAVAPRRSPCRSARSSPPPRWLPRNRRSCPWTARAGRGGRASRARRESADAGPAPGEGCTSGRRSGAVPSPAPPRGARPPARAALPPSAARAP